MKSQVQEIHENKTSIKQQLDTRSTIFEELVFSKELPEREKSIDRLFQEGQTVVAAGTETTAWGM